MNHQPQKQGFIITSNERLFTDYKIRYSVTQDGDFLLGSANTSSPVTELFNFTGSGNVYTAPLNLTINDDSNPESLVRSP